MKRLILFCLPIVFLIGCSKDSSVLSPQDKTAYKDIAYKSLTAQEKSTLINPDTALIDEGNYKYENNALVILSPRHKIYIDKDHIIYFGLIDTSIVLVDNQKLISVLFNTTQDALIGPIDVIIDPFSNQAIGQVFRY